MDIFNRKITPEEGYELAKQHSFQGMSGFHSGFFLPKNRPPIPISFCGWAVCKKAGIFWDGLAFQIEKACFGSREPLLYYTDDDGWLESKADANCKAIETLSSGITDLRFSEGRLLFRLDKSKLRRDVDLYDTYLTKEDGPYYILVLPRCGEFQCQLGEMLEGKPIPLNNDSFCMK